MKLMSSLNGLLKTRNEIMAPKTAVTRRIVGHIDDDTFWEELDLDVPVVFAIFGFSRSTLIYHPVGVNNNYRFLTVRCAAGLDLTRPTRRTTLPTYNKSSKIRVYRSLHSRCQTLLGLEEGYVYIGRFSLTIRSLNSASFLALFLEAIGHKWGSSRTPSTSDEDRLT